MIEALCKLIQNNNKLILTCMLCTVNLWIVIDSDGNCIEIRDEQTTYPCTDEIKRDTCCWDENGETELCGASWIQVES